MNKLELSRRRNRLTQTQLGDMLGVSKHLISKWENELLSVDPKHFNNLKKILGLTESDFEIQKKKAASNDTSCLSQKYISKLEQYIALLEKYIALLENNAKKEE